MNGTSIEFDRKRMNRRKNRYLILSGFACGVFVSSAIDIFNWVVKDKNDYYILPIIGLILGLFCIPFFIRYLRINKSLNKEKI
jgi:preprotein translocase subunit Sec63